ncbi:MAG: MotA/TolQ/ExbB proton channel family protein [Planctomycetota bacterium]|jgi:biopolymer transport protein ExbB
MTRPLPLTCIVLLLPILLVALPAAAQDASSSFADQFFISRKTNPGGEKTVELLGSVIIWFLLLLSVLSIGLIGNLALTNQRKSILPQTVVDEVRRLLSAGEYRRVLDLTEREPSFFGQVLRAALGEANHGFGAVLRSLEQTSDELATQRLRRIEYLNVLGQVSPMIGLFGTVYGMILAFQSIVVAGGNADPVLLAGGISTALTTTFWGLVVAIPALAGYGIIRTKIDELTTEATLTAQELVNQFRPKPRTRPAAPAKDADEAPASDDTT